MGECVGGFGNLAFVDGIMSKAIYLSMLKESLLQNVGELAISPDFCC